jgi:hypothetical protein
MKALLEFAYPEDEAKLKHALRGTEYFEALCDIDNILAGSHTKAEAHNMIKEVIHDVLGGA